VCASIVVPIGIPSVVIVETFELCSVGVMVTIINGIVVALSVASHVIVALGRLLCAGAVVCASIVVPIGIPSVVVVETFGLYSTTTTMTIINGIVVALSIASCIIVARWLLHGVK